MVYNGKLFCGNPYAIVIHHLSCQYQIASAHPVLPLVMVGKHLFFYPAPNPVLYPAPKLAITIT